MKHNKGKSFICAFCQGTFTLDRDEAKLMAEFHDDYGDEEPGDELMCDSCYDEHRDEIIAALRQQAQVTLKPNITIRADRKPHPGSPLVIEKTPHPGHYIDMYAWATSKDEFIK